MSNSVAVSSTPVLVVGAGPVGLTAALELRRRGIACRIVDGLSEPPQYAKAVGVQPRTLELWEAAGVLPAALDAALALRGQLVYKDGALVADVRMQLPPDMPFGFTALPQYETERILADTLAGYGTVVERGVRLTSFTQDDTGVAALLDSGEEIRAGYLVGADGAHSTVRKGLGLTFEGAAFSEEYMLGDVEVDWSLPAGHAVRLAKGDDLLVAIPLPGDHRYRLTMLAPPELGTPPPADGEIAHGFEGGRRPTLADLQTVLDRLAPEAATARTLRWSSVFRISHRIVDAYSRGRVFVAGDAAHIHPPTGGQGMNTGIQDAVNLAWKLALAVRGEAAPGLLASYDAERRPVGEEVVGRTTAAARGDGVVIDPDDPWVAVRREAQLLVGYRGSPIVGPPAPDLPAGAPQPGDRAPDARGLRREIAQYPLRLLPLLGSPRHTVVLYADSADAAAWIRATAAALPSGVDVLAVVAAELDPVTGVPTVVDAEGEFRAAYAATDGSSFLIRPDLYLAARTPSPDPAALRQALALSVMEP
ncbi:FAD-dependent monooxygenase [Pseudonocardia ailaonensis]|uniref:FAD-dependent monooxygenase n=1 Tax=Pseudonocardia ailaonensis TaxID=367279 RepID=A0ABN2MQA5_9PSEU